MTPPSTRGEPVRFHPGTMLGERYRIVGLLGRGGMGEVYRADDLKLARPVALKFLPEQLEQDRGRLERFLNEVRVALRVSHVNVCRVHDIGEQDGQHYITMEYVDGEDLASLLRRIGRFPGERALQIVRQLCAGVGAAHEQGILHRDLKPANVMIDGRGQVKITDFGLAGVAAEIGGEEVRAGTPAYMAPEQLAGKEVTQRSDIYALGLVLYEIFTGRPAFEGRTAADFARRHQTTPTSPSSHVSDLDPAVERIILRCLEPEPNDRPSSAMAVVAALPGGDPLAAALAAGETPSPELVAQAGVEGGLKPAWAVTLLILLVLAVGLLVGSSSWVNKVASAALDKSPPVLIETAQGLIADLGYTDPPADSLFAFVYNEPYYDHVYELGNDAPSLDALKNPQPAALRFVYRRSPRPLVKMSAGAFVNEAEDPPDTLAGMVRVELDAVGRLVGLLVVPSGVPAAPGFEPDWKVLFEAAGFDIDAFTPVEPTRPPPVYGDARRAWSGVYPDAPDVDIRVEAAAYNGKPVSFEIVEPWTPAPEDPGRRGRQDILFPIIFGGIMLSSMIAGAIVAARNVRLGRGDRRTAFRLGVYLAAMRLLWMINAHHVSSGEEVGMIMANVAWTAWQFCLIYVMYLAAEPYVRRLWPRVLVTWVRLARGNFRDPQVGRDLLIGLLAGCVLVGINRVAAWSVEISGMGSYPLIDELQTLGALRGVRGALFAVIAHHTNSVLFVLAIVMFLLLLRMLLRRTWLAVGVISLMFIGVSLPDTGPVLPALIATPLLFALFWALLFRFGLLSFAASFAIAGMFDTLPLTFDLTAWYSATTWITAIVVLGLGFWGFWTALAGRPLFADEILRD